MCLGGLEQELIRDFLRRELSWWDRRRFEQRLRGSADLREKTAAARALRMALAGVGGSVAASSGASEGRARLPPLGKPAWAFAAALLCAVVWLSVERVRLQREVEHLRSAAARATAPQTPVLSFVLSPGVSRSAASPRRLLVSGTEGRVRLRLEVPPAVRSARYKAVLRTVDGAYEVWSGVAAVPAPQATLVDVEVPAANLKAGDYVLSLQAPGASGEWDEVE